MKQMKVDAIKDGTVIDHIPAGTALRVLEILGDCDGNTVMIGMNFSSRKHGRKDIVKIENRELSSAEINRIALVAPEADVTIIRNFEISLKTSVQVPELISGLIRCPNPACITNNTAVLSEFMRESRSTLRCSYCEKPYTIAEVEILRH